MSYCRFLLVPFLLGSVLLLTGALTSKSCSISQRAAVAAPVPDLLALKLVDRALDVLEPSKVSWMELELWQQVEVQGFSYQAQGRYLAGPGHRLRLELNTQLGDASGGLLIVSDGQSLWQARRIGPAGWFGVTRTDLKEVLTTLNSPTSQPQVRDEFFQMNCFGGLAPLVRNLRDTLIWTRKESVRRKGRDCIKLTGVRPTDTAGADWPAGLPRQGRLYLDAHTLWPFRLEWWGPPSMGSADTLLMQMEFRNPVLNRPVPAERWAHEFALEPGLCATDQTGAVTGQLKARAQELAQRQHP